MSIRKNIVETTPRDLAFPPERVDFIPQDFDDAIDAHGVDVLVERALKCPCVDRQTGQAQSSCKNCDGMSWLFINRKQTRILMQNMSMKRSVRDWSEINGGEARITVRPEDKMGFMDKVIVTNQNAYFTQLLFPENFYGEYLAVPIYPPIDIEFIFAFVGVDRKLVLLNQEDYNIVDGYKIQFNSYINERNPTFTIRYKHNPIYHLINVERDMMDQTIINQGGGEQRVRMPLNGVVRKSQYIFDQLNLAGNNLLDNSIG